MGILVKNEANEVYALLVYFEVYNQLIVNHLNILNSQKLNCIVALFSLKIFHGFVSLAQVEYVTDRLSSVLFCIIVLFYMAAAVKSFKKQQYAPTRTHK